MTAARWEDLATRARGLATHLLDARTIAALPATAAEEGLRPLAAALRGHGYPLPDGEVTPDDLELAVRRQAGARLAVLARWAGARNDLLAVIFEDEDRRSIRALVRGAVQSTAAELRVAGLVPTPELPERALRELAEQPSPGTIAVLLTAWGNPYGPALLREAKATQPNLLAIESALNVTFAERALRGGRATGNRVVMDHVRETIDLENALAALVLAGTETGAPRGAGAKQSFVTGGRRLSLPAFLETIAAGDPALARRVLARAFRDALPLARVFEHTADPSSIEEQLLRARIALLQQAELRDPAGVAAVLRFALRVRAEVIAVRRVIWGVVLGAPQDSLVAS
ncbi:MAG TPA: V-type ATPase subunit [Gemmatimonadales bacterium]|jgi:vacuolar-type H+-ATPase subunit C/Vma6